MPMLKKNNAPKLLRTVGGKEHAGPQDHAEERAAGQHVENHRQLTEDEINADPMSSSDEFEAEIVRRAENQAQSPRPPLRSPSLPSNMSKKDANFKRTHTKSAPASDSRPDTKRTWRQPIKTMSVPAAGSFSEGQKSKRKIHEVYDEGKENLYEASSSSGDKRPWDGVFGWGSRPSIPSKKPKVPVTQYSSSKKSNTPNIHATRPNNEKKLAITKKEFQRPKTFTSKKVELTQDDSESDVSLIDDSDPDVQLNKMTEAAERKGFKLRAKNLPPPSPPPKPRPNLLASLSVYKQPESSPLDMNNDTPPTSQDPNTLNTLEDEVANLPDEEALNSTCPLCQEPVDPSHSIRFWKYHNKTIRNQSKFCKEHRERSARVEYAERGYPQIVWSELPNRIRKLRSRLEKVLRNEDGFESKYRVQNAAKLVSGQAAVYRPKQRKKRLERIEDIEGVDDGDTELLHDTSSTSTGYYGPRGRRLMMEVLTTDLGDVFREVAVIDPVVGKSGFAEYIEHVLVPELTVMLVRDDLGVDEGKAEEVIKHSTELGMILYEDVDDVVAERSDDGVDGRELFNIDDDDDEKYEELLVVDSDDN